MHTCIGEGNGSPLKYSCLENPRDGGAWWAAVYGVAQSSRTRLKWLSSSSSIRSLRFSSITKELWIYFGNLLISFFLGISAWRWHDCGGLTKNSFRVHLVSRISPFLKVPWFGGGDIKIKDCSLGLASCPDQADQVGFSLVDLEPELWFPCSQQCLYSEGAWPCL